MLLAIDTSTAQVGVALIDGDELAVETIWTSKVHHTVELAPAVAALLARTGARISDVTAIGIAMGPGSFTSLRVGMSFAKGLVLARQMQIVGVPTLDVLAAGQPPSNLPLVAVLQAGRSRLAVGWYRNQAAKTPGGSDALDDAEGKWAAQGPPQVMTVEALAKSIAKPAIVAGELTTETRTRLARKRVNVTLAPINRCVRRPSVLAEIALTRLQTGQADDVATLAPIYLHQAELPAA